MAVTLHTTLGDLKLELYCETAPRTAFNFLSLAALGTYDGTLFHRNIKGFMVQGGDPTGTGKGGASVWGEGNDFDDEFHAENRHAVRGIVSMANKGPNTNRSQFFITYTKAPHLNSQYTVFGRVIDGMDVLDALERQPVGKKSKPLTDVVVTSLTIHSNPLADKGQRFPTVDGPMERTR